MASLYTHQSANVWRTWGLMTVFLVLIMLVGWAASMYFGSTTILYVFVGFSILLNFFSYWYSDKIALRMSRAIPADEHQYKALHRMVENLSIAAGLPKPRVYIIPDAAPNAFATGRDKHHAAVAVTEGLLARLEPVELEGVIAHELAHIGNRDILLASVVVVLVGLISLLADGMARSMLFGGGDRDNRNGLMIALAIIVAILAPLLATIIQLAISRKREFLADTTAALLTRYPEGLASALEKIALDPRPVTHASTATAHLYIANPLGGKMNGVRKLFMTHPPAEERIRVLRSL